MQLQYIHYKYPFIIICVSYSRHYLLICGICNTIHALVATTVILGEWNYIRNK